MIESSTLDAQFSVFQRERERLLAESEGKYAVVGKNAVVGIGDAYDDTLRAGYQQFGLQPFLVKQILRVERVVTFSRAINSWAAF